MNIHIYMHNERLTEGLESILCRINSNLEKIMATQAEEVVQLKAVLDQLVKIGGETTLLLKKITALEAAIAAGGNTTPEVDAALAALKSQAQVVDDLVPDAPPPPPPPAP